jgi:hypothetical protein
MPVAIAGMHRSGTSLVAKVLCRGGLYFGKEEDIVGPADDNPDGFWENRKFVELSDEILSALGGGWDHLPELTEPWEDRDAVARLRTTARLLLGEFKGREPWGWKDPRNSVLLPFWQALIEELRVVICVRNPLEVALSLHGRNSLSYSL